MARTVVEIDPITRVSGLLSIKAQIEDGKITNANSSGMQIRGFEKMLQGRPPLDAIRLTARTCGICSVSHTLASSMVLEMALGVKPDFNGELIRSMAHGFETLQNNLRQFYQFVVPDYVNISGVSPLYPNIPVEESDFRLPKDINDRFISHYQDAIAYSRSAHKAQATIAGKAPHNHGVFVGGITTNFDISMFNIVKSTLYDIKKFVVEIMIPDIEILMQYYPEYKQWGKSGDNYLSYGYFEYLPRDIQVAKPGAVINGKYSELNKNMITQSIKYSWLKSTTETLNPLDEPPTLDFSKPGAYSWVDAPRYSGESMEVGPMADYIVNSGYSEGTGALHRIKARCLFTLKVCEIMEKILGYTKLQNAVQEVWKVPQTGEGYALIGAIRGGLGHWVKIENQKIKQYSLLPPSNWNMSPMCSSNIHGACEKALIDTPISDIKKAKVIIGRIVRSFDPCLNCAAHVTSDKAEPFTFQII